MAPGDFVAETRADAAWEKTRCRLAALYWSRVAAALHYLAFALKILEALVLAELGVDTWWGFRTVWCLATLSVSNIGILVGTRPDEAAARMRAAEGDWASLMIDIEDPKGPPPMAAIAERMRRYRASHPPVPFWMDFFIERWMAKRHLPTATSIVHTESRILSGNRGLLPVSNDGPRGDQAAGTWGRASTRGAGVRASPVGIQVGSNPEGDPIGLSQASTISEVEGTGATPTPSAVHDQS